MWYSSEPYDIKNHGGDLLSCMHFGFGLLMLTLFELEVFDFVKKCSIYKVGVRKTDLELDDDEEAKMKRVA